MMSTQRRILCVEEEVRGDGGRRLPAWDDDQEASCVEKPGARESPAQRISGGERIINPGAKGSAGKVMSLGQKRDRVRYYQSQGLALTQSLEVFDLTRHQYYYRPQGNSASRPGCDPSMHTNYHDADGVVSERTNKDVIEAIELIQRDDDLRCGYKRMTAQLHLQGYQINHKKVYRLMRVNNLLLSRLKRPD
ncbi:MAG: transposase [Saprospiraceae bacterium]|nr:transposase [Saprospiraceae bacterium]